MFSEIRLNWNLNWPLACIVRQRVCWKCEQQMLMLIWRSGEKIKGWCVKRKISGRVSRDMALSMISWRRECGSMSRNILREFPAHQYVSTDYSLIIRAWVSHVFVCVTWGHFAPVAAAIATPTDLCGFGDKDRDDVYFMNERRFWEQYDPSMRKIRQKICSTLLTDVFERVIPPANAVASSDGAAAKIRSRIWWRLHTEQTALNRRGKKEMGGWLFWKSRFAAIVPIAAATGLKLV